MKRYDGLINSVNKLEDALRIAEQEMIATIISNSHTEPYEINGIDYERQHYVWQHEIYCLRT